MWKFLFALSYVSNDHNSHSQFILSIDELCKTINSCTGIYLNGLNQNDASNLAKYVNIWQSHPREVETHWRYLDEDKTTKRITLAQESLSFSKCKPYDLLELPGFVLTTWKVNSLPLRKRNARWWKVTKYDARFQWIWLQETISICC